MPSSAPRRPTILDVARHAGVSPTTVSHALNERGYVDPQTRERVKASAQALGYRPNMRAQRLRTGEAQTIALLSSMPFEVAGGASRLGFLMEIAAVAAASALTRGLALILVPPMQGNQLPLERLDIDGAIVIEPTDDDLNVAHLQSRRLPVVSIGRQPADDPVPYVDLQSAATTQLLLSHLWAQGARRIALLIGAQRRNSYVEADLAYRAFCEAHGMSPRISMADEAGGEQAGHDRCAELLRQYPDIDGLYVTVDAFAVGALQAIAEHGLRVPDDIKLVTRYDGLRARTSTPALTAVNLHLDAVASLGVQLLFEHLGGDTHLRHMTPPAPELVARASSAKTRKRSPAR
ncbi:LacI family transcriptional regulator [Pandoraea thiooxydans]|uniref:LacI family transcriptional regulator n=1 Tax=Pandoraea thiooxydans TaxID=445709 RepID=A0A0G3EQ16_9BURK|nr:LacI family DNA-binding transcriptional regulator [Pandoraea thiooxydans]AKJ69173.1 LacI family transcriptional regulator [Pandoraea thiooxydans]APR96763.1 LacI family transcriptional regulator [Pandoraea thiooxydans]MDE2610983.1 LacI family DNA-binding transcriptional regulator [Burkholderiales bacterium]